MLIVIYFFEIMKILKLYKAYIIASTFASILLMFPFSLYFPLVYLHFFYSLNIYGVLLVSNYVLLGPT